MKFDYSFKKASDSEIDEETLNKLKYYPSTYTHLNFKSKGIQTIQWGIFDELKCITILNFSNNQINYLDSNVFKSLTTLKILNFSSNQIAHIDSNLFNGLVNLIQIDFSYNKISILNPAFNSLTNLNYMNFSNNRINSIHPNAFNFLTNLKWLYLFNNNLDKFSINLKISKDLLELDLSSNKLTLVDFHRMFQTTKLMFGNSIAKIYLDNNQISNINNISIFSGRSSLLIISLNGNKLKYLNDDFVNFANSLPLTPFYLKINLLNNFFEDYYKLELRNIIKNFDKIINLDNNLMDDGYLNSITVNNSTISNDYQHLLDFSWQNISMFSAITGKNGCGKTSLLKFIENEFLRYYKSNKKNDTCLSFNKKDNGSANLTDTKVMPVFLQFHKSIISNDDILAYFHQKLVENIGPQLNSGTYFLRRSPYLEDDKLAFGYNSDTPNQIGSSITSFYSIKLAIKYLKNDLDNLNKNLESDGFKYKIKFDDFSSNQTEAVFYYESNKNLIELKEDNLSPGEKLILLFSIWKYIFSRYELACYTILLLDEPDSHLHPTGVNQMVNILKKLTQLGVQVILTTHNPTTIGLIPTENVYLLEMRQKEGIKIEKSLSKFNIYKHLTPHGIIRVENFYKIIFVEGKTDKPFYDFIYKRLKNLKIISDDVNLIFRPLEEKYRNKAQVLDLIQKIISTHKMERINEIEYFEKSLDNLVYAIVDDDNEKYRGTRIIHENLFYLERYSFENYLWDPINLFFFFLYHTNSKDIKINPEFNNYILNKFKSRQLLSEKYLSSIKSLVKDLANINYEEKIIMHIPKSKIPNLNALPSKQSKNQSSLNRLERSILIAEKFSKTYRKIKEDNDFEEIITLNDILFKLNRNPDDVILLLNEIIHDISDFIFSTCFQTEYIETINDIYLRKLIDYMPLIHKFNGQSIDLDSIREKQVRLKKLNDFIYNKKENSFKSCKIFKLKINLYKIFELYENNGQFNPLNEFLPVNGYEFDTFKELIRLKWMKDYLEANKCPLKSLFYTIETNIIKITDEKYKLIKIIDEVLNEYKFQDILKQTIAFDNEPKETKIVLNNDENKLKELLTNIDHPDVIEFIISVSGYNLKPLISQIKQTLNKNPDLREIMNENLNEIVTKISNRFESNELKYLKELVQYVFADQLCNIFEFESEKFMVHINNNANNRLVYNQFYFRIRGHDIEKIYANCFLDKNSNNIFDLSKKMDQVLSVFDKIGFFIPYEIKKYFEKLAKSNF